MINQGETDLVGFGCAVAQDLVRRAAVEYKQGEVCLSKKRLRQAYKRSGEVQRIVAYSPEQAPGAATDLRAWIVGLARTLGARNLCRARSGQPCRCLGPELRAAVGITSQISLIVSIEDRQYEVPTSVIAKPDTWGWVRAGRISEILAEEEE